MLRAGGDDLRRACAAFGGCESGAARITRAYGLSALHVIHVVPPIWYDGFDGEERVLAKCYQRCFAFMSERRHQTALFPSLGTGGHGFPLEIAAPIALRSTTEFLQSNDGDQKISFVCLEADVFDAYETLLSKL